MLASESLCHQIGAAQHGLLSRHQALEAGMTPRAIERRLQSGVWSVARPNVYRIVGAPQTWHQHELALCLWAGEGAMSAGRAAAALYRLRTFPAHVLEVSSPQRLNPPPDAVVHLLAPYLETESLMLDGIPTPPIERVVYEIAVTCGKRRARTAFEYALVNNLTTIDRFAAFIGSIARRGRPGIRISRELLNETDPRAQLTRSRAEIEMLSFFDGYSLPVLQVDHDIYHPDGHYLATADFASPEVKLDIEADGDPVHTTAEDRLRDKRRDRLLGSIGWTVIRFTNHEIFREKPRVVRDVRAMLIRLGHPFFAKTG